jgi:surface protein
MCHMFNGAMSFNQPLAAWDVRKVTNMSYMFDNASSFNQSLDTWDLDRVPYKTGMLTSYHRTSPVWHSQG